MKFLGLASIALATTLAATAFAADITPTRVGPVSQYGKLMAGKNAQGKGRIYGSCEGVKDGAEVQVKGMSLYWSLMDEALEFWTDEGITSMVNDMKIQIVRAAMATGDEDWTKGKYVGYQVQPDKQKGFMKAAVEAAIKNDIYVIIDWHSHVANTQTDNAVKFFTEMAQEYGKYDHVIFELFNEPQKIKWDEVKNYANQVISAIRQYSDNLILVGNPEWDQNPQQAIGNEVNDPKKNVAYTLHYYAGSHKATGDYEWGPGEGARGQQAIDAGLSVFVSEWGTGNADGKGDVSPNNGAWQDFMNQNMLSWANWSASKINEGTAAFSANATKTSLQYSNSGNTVKGYLSSNPATYTACKANQPVVEPVSSSSNEIIAIPVVKAQDFSLRVQGRTLQLNSIGSGNTKVEVFDMLGHAQLQKEALLRSGSNAISLEEVPMGNYVVRVRQGNNIAQAKFQVK